MRQTTDAGSTLEAWLAFAFINLPNFSKRFTVRKSIWILKVYSAAGIA